MAVVDAGMDGDEDSDGYESSRSDDEEPLLEGLDAVPGPAAGDGDPDLAQGVSLGLGEGADPRGHALEERALLARERVSRGLQVGALHDQGGAWL